MTNQDRARLLDEALCFVDEDILASAMPAGKTGAPTVFRVPRDGRVAVAAMLTAVVVALALAVVAGMPSIVTAVRWFAGLPGGTVEVTETESETKAESESDVLSTEIESETERDTESETEKPLTGLMVESLKEYFFTDQHLIRSYPLPGEEGWTEPLLYDGINGDDFPRVDEQTTSKLDVTYAIRLIAEHGTDGANYCGMSYIHYRNATTFKENLLVYLDAPTGVDLILVFETNFGNTEAFRQAVAEGSYFDAKLIQCANGNTKDGIILGYGHLGYTFSNGRINWPLRDEYHRSIAISSGYASRETGDRLSFDLLEDDHEKLRVFEEFIVNFGIKMNMLRNLVWMTEPEATS